MPIVQFVSYGDTIADIAQTEKTSASLTATTSILLAVLLIISFLTNILLVATILASYKLRNCLLYLMLCQLGIANAIDTILIMFVSLLYVANGTWTFGDLICRANTWAQEFLSLYSFFIITLMAMERALGLTANGRNLVTGRYALAFSVIFGTVAFCFAAPAFLSSFSVRPYPFRYLCAVGKAPLVYSIVQMVAFGGCIFVNTICFGALIRYNNIDRSLPARPQDYGAFIMESRALQDYMTHGRLVFFIFLAFILVQGPYIVLNFFVQIRNSEELLKGDVQLEMSQDIDTLITWLKFFFPLLVTLLVFTTCHDIWIKLVNLVCCRRSNGVWTSQKGNNQQFDNRGRMPNDNVLTLVATTDGLQIRVPDGQFIKPPPIRCQWEEDTLSNFQELNQYDEREETPSESKTHKIIHPKVLKIPSGFSSERKKTKIPKRAGQSINNKSMRVAKNTGKTKKANSTVNRI